MNALLRCASVVVMVVLCLTAQASADWYSQCLEARSSASVARSESDYEKMLASGVLSYAQGRWPAYDLENHPDEAQVEAALNAAWAAYNAGNNLDSEADTAWSAAEGYKTLGDMAYAMQQYQTAESYYYLAYLEYGSAEGLYELAEEKFDEAEGHATNANYLMSN